MRSSLAPTLVACLCACARPSLPARALPEGVRVETAHAGRYAMLLETEHRGGCSMSNFFSTSRASVVLSLEEDGSATGCRGRRWTSTVEANVPEGEEDPHPDVTELIEQQGMRGTWRASGDALRVDLALDDSICPPIRNAASLEARPWSLECVAVAPSQPRADVEPPFPALACRLVGIDSGPGMGAYPHDVGYTVAADPFLFFGRDTIFLAPDAGVEIEEHAYGGLFPEGMRTWKRPAQPIASNAWSSPP